MDIQKKNEEVFAVIKQKFGFVPNLFKTLSVSPAVSEVYLRGFEAMEGASLDNREIQALNLAVSTENNCNYCKAAHTATGKGAGVSPEDLALIKEGKSPKDEGLNALVTAARLIVRKRGHLTEEELDTIGAMGVNRGKVYEIIAIIGLKTISNYVNHIANTEIDREFQGG
ncbi:MAG: carboxymuconolactone decarboxylase family protein [Thermodesulfobacteriota bacterium]|nr:MAG: carboxymuconolactone decarboxylase family protein [Thermodesulfobacteriota bacterium]